MSDEYCFAEHCRYRHWQSGSMPTHRKGEGCPKEYMPSTDEVRDAYVVGVDPEVTARYRAEFDRWHAAELRRAKAEAWEECASVTEDIITDLTGNVEPYLGMLANPYRADQIEKEATR